ncbi:MAG: hypothetical protein ABSB49_00105 [Polyangia bacterium]|jgi:hypothetical protein
MTNPDRCQQKRKLRNYLLDASLQLRYTVFILAVAVSLTAVLGYRIYVATQETTRVVIMTASVEPSTAHELEVQLKANDRVVFWWILAFGVVLVVTVTAAGIWMTHKIVGPLYKIGLSFGRIRDNKLASDSGKLRKGDQLQAFHAAFREMYDALRARVVRDNAVLEKALAAIAAEPSRSPALEAAAAELGQLQRDKAASLNL